MSTEDQFKAAVNVIRNLPSDAKNAPFSPSDELKLKFYAFFKQATEGPNETSKPSFYDIVGKYKWSAWKQLGEMSKEDAMNGYVNELKKIVETMALTEPVADFYEVLGPFYEYVELDKKKKPNGYMNGNAIIPEDNEINVTSPVAKPNKHDDVNNGESRPVNGITNGAVHECESDGEEFSDTYDHIAEDPSPTPINGKGDEIISARGEAELTPPRFTANIANRSSAGRQQNSRGTVNQIAAPGSSQGSAGGSGGGGHFSGREPIPEVNEQIAVAVLRLQQHMEHVVNRIDSLESRLGNVNTSKPSPLPSWWPLPGISPTTTAFLILWPFVAQIIMNKIRERRNH
jgi:acyl-CoA-binding protein